MDDLQHRQQTLFHPQHQLVQRYPQYSDAQPTVQYDNIYHTVTAKYDTTQPSQTRKPATSSSIPSRKRRITPKKKPGAIRIKATNRSPHLSRPLSEATEDSHAPLIDIDTYVHRSTEERLEEVMSGKVPGKVKRPMNAFMLYRKAYQNLAKEYCPHNKVVSQVCGLSWQLEPNHVRAKFADWANIERANHHEAHPSYKFNANRHKSETFATDRKSEEYDDDEDKDKQFDFQTSNASVAEEAIPTIGHCPIMQVRHSPFEHVMYEKPVSPATMTSLNHSGFGEPQMSLIQCPNARYSSHHGFSPLPVSIDFSGTADELMERADNVRYPHQMDPAAWHAGQMVGGQQEPDINASVREGLVWCWR